MRREGHLGSLTFEMRGRARLAGLRPLDEELTFDMRDMTRQEKPTASCQLDGGVRRRCHVAPREWHYITHALLNVHGMPTMDGGEINPQ
jgi:hypothetical protein